MPGSCCAPSAPARDSSAVAEVTVTRAGSADGMVELPGGELLMGSAGPHAYPDDGEGPVRRVGLEPFWIDIQAVSNADFARFVEATRHDTEAERFGWSFVFAGLLPDEFPPTRGVAHAPWWRQVEHADWRHPEGPQSDLDGRSDHPVVHVSGTTSRPIASGPASACRPKRSGNTPLAAVSKESSFPGVTSSSRAASTA